MHGRRAPQQDKQATLLCRPLWRPTPSQDPIPFPGPEPESQETVQFILLRHSGLSDCTEETSARCPSAILALHPRVPLP